MSECASATGWHDWGVQRNELVDPTVDAIAQRLIREIDTATLAGDVSGRIRLASSPELSDWHTAHLANDNSTHVLLSLLANPRCSDQAIEVLAEHQEITVAARAKAVLATRRSRSQRNKRDDEWPLTESVAAAHDKATLHLACIDGRLTDEIARTILAKNLGPRATVAHELAVNANLSGAFLDELAVEAGVGGDDTHMWVRLIRNPATAAVTLERIADKRYLATRSNVLGHPNCPARTIIDATAHLAIEALLAAAGNPALDPRVGWAILRRLTGDRGVPSSSVFATWSALAANPAASPELLSEVARHARTSIGRSTIMRTVARAGIKNPATPTHVLAAIDVETLAELGAARRYAVRLLARLASSGDELEIAAGMFSEHTGTFGELIAIAAAICGQQVPTTEPQP